MNFYELGFYNEKLKFQLGFNLYIEAEPFSIKQFLALSELLSLPSGQTLRKLVLDSSTYNWKQFRWDSDPKSKWIKACLDLTLAKYGLLTPFLLKWIIKKYSVDVLFQVFAMLNGLVLFFDPPEELTSFNMSKPSKTLKLDQDLWIFAELQKLEIKELNGKKLTIQNLQDVLNYPQYLYFCRSRAIQEALILVNPNLIPAEEKKKKIYDFNILKHHETLTALMKTFGIDEKDWYSEKAKEHLIQINDQLQHQKLYELFRLKEGSQN